MNIKIIAVGGLKEAFLREAQQEFLKRLSPFCKISVLEIDETPVSKPQNRELIDRALEREADKILEKCVKTTIIALCIEGGQLTSLQFAHKLRDYANEGIQNLSFIIGGSHGLAERVKEAADFKLSFSKMTFPHQLFRVTLLEQIYRAFDINGAKRYDK